jgi:hypothetical protein
MLITLDQIQAEHTRLGQLIAQLQTPASKLLVLPESASSCAPANATPALCSRRWPGQPSPGPAARRRRRRELAGRQRLGRRQGGELPTRQEQSLLYANLKAEFQPDWYWSSEQTHSDSSFAWLQYFGRRHSRATTTRAMPAEPEPSADFPLDPLILH